MKHKKKIVETNEKPNEKTTSTSKKRNRLFVLGISFIVLAILALTIALTVSTKLGSLFHINDNSSDTNVTRLVGDEEEESKMTGKGSYKEYFTEEKGENDYYAGWD